MTTPEILGFVSGIFLIGGYIPYIVDVIKKTTIPNRASWFIWALSTAILLVEVHATGTREAIWVPIADAVGCFVIFLLSIRRGVGGWAFTDKISLFVCLCSIVVWFLTGNVLLALIMNVIIYMSGYVSTIKKVLVDSRSESFVAWTFFFIGVLLNLLTIVIGTDSGFAVWVYPVILVATVGTLYALLLRGLSKRRF